MARHITDVALPCVNGLSSLPIAELPEQCFAILGSFAIVVGLRIEELPEHRFKIIGSFEIVLCLRRRYRLVAVQPLLCRREAGPTRERSGQRHFPPFRMEWRPLQRLDFGKERVDKKHQATIPFGPRRPVVGGENC